MATDAFVDPLVLAARHLGAAPAYLVGGRVRDMLLGRPTMDTDVVVLQGAMSIARGIAKEHGGAFVALDEERGIARIVWRHGHADSMVLDITDAVGGALLSDLAARDFTVNALAVPLASIELGAIPFASKVPPLTSGETKASASEGRLPWPDDAITDIHDGLSDLDAGLIRACAPEAFIHDPLRLLRAPRLAAELSFNIEAETAACIREHASSIVRPAAERVRDELLRLLAQDPPDEHLALLEELGLRVPLLPELGPQIGPGGWPSLASLSLTSPPRTSPPRTSPPGTSPPPYGDDQPGAAGSTPLAMAASALDSLARVQALVNGLDVPPPTVAAGLLVGRHRDGLNQYLDERHTGGRPRGVWLRIAALLLPLVEPSSEFDGKNLPQSQLTSPPVTPSAPVIATIARRLRLGGAEATLVEHAAVGAAWVWQLCMQGMPTHRQVYRFHRALGSSAVGAIVMAMSIPASSMPASSTPASSMPPSSMPEPSMASAGVTGVGSLVADALLAAGADRLLSAAFDEPIARISPPPLLDGRELMTALELPPGPLLGQVLESLREATAAGEIQTRDEALGLARSLVGPLRS